jgi:SAM-dependent methyltransferase
MSSASDHIVNLYERRADEWAGDRSSEKVFIEKAWLDRFCALVKPGRTILDLGCGPGKPMAAYLMAQGFNICGVDSSSTMITLARGHFPERELIVADMRRLSLGRQFDAVMAWDSFFHLNHDDQRRMLPIFRAHAKLRAPLLFTNGPQHGEDVGRFRGEPLCHASLVPDEYRALFAAHGFEPVTEKVEDPDCGLHSVWLARRTEDGQKRP